MKTVNWLLMSLVLALAVVQSSYAHNADVLSTRSATMTVVDSWFGFEGVTQVELSLTRTDETAPYTGLTLQYQDEIKHLNIIETLTDDEGCTLYTAKLPLEDEAERFYVSLTDRSTCSSTTSEPAWVAIVRHGYGWCGTEDAGMELVGTPTN